MGLQTVGHDWATFTFFLEHWGFDTKNHGHSYTVEVTKCPNFGGWSWLLSVFYSETLGLSLELSWLQVGIMRSYLKSGASHLALVVKNPPANAGDIRNQYLIPRPGRSPGRRHGNPLQHSLLEESHGQRRLAGYSPWGHKKSDTTEQLPLWRLIPSSGDDFVNRLFMYYI